MGWASRHIQELTEGRTVKFRPHGGSMSGIVESGQLVTVEPVTEQVQKGDVVLCKVRGRAYLHLVKEIKHGSVLIGNNRGGINGWTSTRQVYGILARVED